MIAIILNKTRNKDVMFSKSMKAKLILSAITEAISPYWRPIKYSLFPPLGLATLAGFLSEDDKIQIVDEHIEKLNLNDQPDLVAIQVYTTSAYRSYKIADHYRKKGTYVCLGGLHTTSMPQEALKHADSIFLGPGEDIWPQFLEDLRKGCPHKIYQSTQRTLENLPQIRRDLIKRELYLMPNSIVVSRGCPYNCDFCYKDSFFKGGKSFYTQAVDKSLEQIDKFPGKHLFFLDDNLFADIKFASELFEGMKGMRRLWQGAGNVKAVLNNQLLQKAVNSGMRSLFIGFETINESNLSKYNKKHNQTSEYDQVIRNLHRASVMINASFVFGMDDDNKDVFDRTVEWALNKGIETATFHILTPYPGTKLYERLISQNRITIFNWDMYDTRHAVFKPAMMTSQTLEEGYWRAYKNFYSWNSIIKSVFIKDSIKDRVRHLVYTAGWKKSELLWKIIIKTGKINMMLPLLEKILTKPHYKTATQKDGLDLNQPVELLENPETIRCE